MVTVGAFPRGEAERYGIKVTRSFTTPSAGDLGEIARLVEVKDALALSEAGRGRGKIVLKLAD